MKILVYVEHNNAVAYHRLIFPFMTLADADCYVTNDIIDPKTHEPKEERFKGLDLFVYNRILPEKILDIVYKQQLKYDFKIMVDIDDHWLLDEHHSLYKHYQEINYVDKQIHQLRNANFTSVTHERLQAEVLKINSACYILENTIAKQGQFEETKTLKSKEIRLFYQGSVTHEKDIALLVPVMSKLSVSKLNIRSVIAGYVDEPVWNKIVFMYTAFGKLPYSVLHNMSMNAYYKVYGHADICLVPLLDTWFNGMKSNLKVLEAANMGLPVIASNVDPYKDLPILYANSKEEWFYHIKELVKHKKQRQKQGSILKEFCDFKYDFKTINYKRRKAIEYETGK